LLLSFWETQDKQYKYHEYDNYDEQYDDCANYDKYDECVDYGDNDDYMIIMRETAMTFSARFLLCV
jgi:hypothetical protein